MQEIVGDLFKSVKADVICITTNGWTKKDGSCVMGRGCADGAKKRWPGVEYALGEALKRGNTPHILTYATEESGGKQILLPTPDMLHIVPYHVVSFPVKPTRCGGDQLLPRFQSAETSSTTVHPGWMSQAKPELIKYSADLLSKLADVEGWKSIVIPKPGCGAGGLNWSDVKPLLSEILDDKFYIIDFPRR
jgi:hypothetical protein